MPKTLSPDEVKAILERGNFEDLIGAVEDDRLEYKAAPYGLKHDHQKQELAKDVAGLANAGGGIILIGVRTEKDPTHFGDEIKEIRTFPQQLVNPSQYQDILRTWIYPTLQQVEIQWFPSSGDPKKGIVAIFIPKQASSRRPFLLTRFIDDTGKRVEVLFGYVERKQANVIPFSVEEIQVLIRDGQRYEESRQQYTSLEEMLGQLQQDVKAGKEKPPESNTLQLLNDRMLAAREKARLANRPAFTLAVSPVNTIEIQEVFKGRGAKIVQIIDNPPELRLGGFSLNTGASSEIVRGQLRRAVNPGIILEVWRDGTLIFAADGGADFLSWGRRTIAEGPLYINPLVLIESTYLFSELSRQIYGNATPQPKEIEYRLELRNMTVRGKPCVLTPGPVGSPTFSTYKAPASNVIHQFRCIGQINPGEVAYGLVREVYRWFSINDNEIPYTELIEGREIISADKIQIVKG